MHILLDECVNAGLRAAFPSHTVETVTEIGWCGSPDRPLLTYAQAQFDVFVTIDGNLEHQQNLRKFDMGFVVIRVPSNESLRAALVSAFLDEQRDEVISCQLFILNNLPACHGIGCCINVGLSLSA